MTGGAREGVAVALLLVAGALAAWGLSLETSTEVRPRTVVIGIDRSTSLTADGCEDLARLGRAALSGRVPTQLVVLATSPAGIVRLGAVRVAPTGRLLEGKGQDGVAMAAQVAEIVSACEALAPAVSSPIARLVERSLAYLPVAECERNRSCQLVIRTDGLEGVDRALRRAVTGRKRRKVAPRFDNEHVTVTFCGLADVRGLKGPTLQRLREAWAATFAHPDTVRFEAACALFAGEVVQ